MERLPCKKKVQQPEEISLAIRTILEGFMKNHFDDDALDELFELLLRRIFHLRHTSQQSLHSTQTHIENEQGLRSFGSTIFEENKEIKRVFFNKLCW